MDVPQPTKPRTIRVTCPAFAEGELLPARFTCKGAGVSPAIAWTGVPPEAVALALVVSDPDAPRGTFVHWLLTGLPAHDGGFAEDTVPAGAHAWPGTARTLDWVPPCPPSGTHRYVFSVYALDSAITGGSSEQVLAKLGAHTLAWGTLTGLVRH